MTMHLVTTDHETTPAAMTDGLEGVGITAQVEAVDLACLAKAAAALVATLPPGEQAPAIARLHHLIDENTGQR